MVSMSDCIPCKPSDPSGHLQIIWFPGLIVYLVNLLEIVRLDILLGLANISTFTHERGNNERSRGGKWSWDSFYVVHNVNLHNIYIR